MIVFYQRCGAPGGMHGSSPGNLYRVSRIERTMTNHSLHLKHFLALLLALIPLAFVVGACVTCP